MDTDVVLTIGLALFVFALPAFLSALADKRPLRASSLCIILAGGCIFWAHNTKPGGYTFVQIPEVVIDQVAKIIR